MPFAAVPSVSTRPNPLFVEPDQPAHIASFKHRKCAQQAEDDYRTKIRHIESQLHELLKYKPAVIPSRGDSAPSTRIPEESVVSADDLCPVFG